MPAFLTSEIDALRAPHVARALFADIELPSGRFRLHNGVGNVNVDGYEWQGLSDPSVGRLASVPSLEEPRFGIAAKVDVVLVGVTADFVGSIREQGLAVEGSPCSLYWAVFNCETQQPLMGLKKLFAGKISAPKFIREGVGTRIVSLAVEGPYHAMNFPFGGRWSSADHRRKYPNDKGFDFIGVKQQEAIK